MTVIEWQKGVGTQTLKEHKERNQICKTKVVTQIYR